ncbi:hypothetical protein [Mesorhizobium sp.]|uniref:hypothetical protein n=1 Tax=Mesorhizobium sp. TaxID=1871066 RepID=UPI0025FE2235|nr:hypothetical protein [Mesorhizobium sp.]
MVFHAPQIILTTLILLGVGRSLARFGKPKKPDEHDIVDVLFAPALLIGLLWWGGFYG